MKSFEELLSENCPAIFDLQAKSWEQAEYINPLAPAEEPQEKLQETIEQPTKIEWNTTKGRRVIDESFLKKMTAGY